MATLRILTAALALTSVLFGGLLYRKSAECDRQAQRLESLRVQTEAFERQAAGSRQQVDSLSTRLADLAPSPIHRLYIDRLRKRASQIQSRI